MLDGKDLAGEQYQPHGTKIQTLEAAVLRKQRENRRRRIPAGALVGDQLPETCGSFPASSPIRTMAAPCLRGT